MKQKQKRLEKGLDISKLITGVLCSDFHLKKEVYLKARWQELGDNVIHLPPDLRNSLSSTLRGTDF